jgi:uncharacterized protein YdiU (UPF0061 family)
MPRIWKLGEEFYDVVAPARFPRHVLRFRNSRAAKSVGLDALREDEWERHFARFEPLLCNLHEPLALRYHGHQFGVYNAQLGDGRGFLFAQMEAAPDTEGGETRILDLGTKGSGQTPWSRGGDGRLTLKGGVREVLATEMLGALGVRTSQSFSLFETGEALTRGDEPSPTRSSVLVRLSHSHIRFGTFQRLAYLDRRADLKRLFDYVLETYMPGLASAKDPVLAMVREVTRRSAELCANWMSAGFVHGVLNTDNMNVTGESFDYGPYRFLPTYDKDFTAAYFDHTGRYAYGRQPEAVLWSLMRFAESLSSVAGNTSLAPALREFDGAFASALSRGVLGRLGLVPVGSRGASEDDGHLVEACFSFLEESQVGFDQFFFDWFGGAASDARAKQSPSGRKYEGARFRLFQRALEGYTPRYPNLLETPYFLADTPCSLLIEEVEGIWRSIAVSDDWSPFYEKVERIRAMPKAWGSLD